MKRLAQELTDLSAQNSLRVLQDSNGLLDFSSNDYLGLASNEHVRTELQKALTEIDLGARGSRLLGGNTIHHARVESFLADTFQAGSATLMSSGYVANVGLLQAIGDAQTHYFSDALNHASLIDGMRLSSAARSIFRHNDMGDLDQALGLSTASRKIIVTESVFSMDGDLAPLTDLYTLALRHDAWLIVDEAHATGIFGPRGLGRVHHPQGTGSNSGPIVITVHTASKSLGAQGAFILGPNIVKQYLINKSRAFIYSTALSPILALQIEIAVREMRRLNSADLRAGEKLLKSAEKFRQYLGAHYDFGRSQSQIIPIVLGSNQKALTAAAKLQARGFDVRAIRAPTVSVGSERLRFTLKSTHTPTQLDRLIQTLREISE